MLDLLQEKEALYQTITKKARITSLPVLEAFQAIPREDFIPPALKPQAYDDLPLPIGKDQTISQPTTVLLMTQWLDPQPGQKILEIGTGSGYQAAILSHLVGTRGKVYTIETLPSLYELGKKHLKTYKNVTVLKGDGSLGYPKAAPFDRIIITAAAPKLPEHLLKQLKKDGSLLVPVGDEYSQEMIRVKKGKNPEKLGGFVFVPLTGKYGKV